MPRSQATSPDPAKPRLRPPTRTVRLQSAASPGELAPFVPCAAHPVRVRARRLTATTRIDPHRHAWAQVAYSSAGVLRVTAEQHTYIVPPSRAVWIPPELEHVVTVVEDAELRTLYLHVASGQAGPVPLGEAIRGDAPATAAAWRRCRVLEVSPLLRVLVEQIGSLATAGTTPPEREHMLAALVQDELCRARPVPLGVGLPADKRLRALCEAVLDDPARHATLPGWAGEAGASVRTVARLFRQELGTTFADWRQQVMLAKALSMAARKRPMAHIATELGYASASAFSAMVTRSVGMPPSRFFAAA